MSRGTRTFRISTATILIRIKRQYMQTLSWSWLISTVCCLMRLLAVESTGWDIDVPPFMPWRVSVVLMVSTSMGKHMAWLVCGTWTTCQRRLRSVLTRLASGTRLGCMSMRSVLLTDRYNKIQPVWLTPTQIHQKSVYSPGAERAFWWVYIGMYPLRMLISTCHAHHSGWKPWQVSWAICLPSFHFSFWLRVLSVSILFVSLRGIHFSFPPPPPPPPPPHWQAIHSWLSVVRSKLFNRLLWPKQSSKDFRFLLQMHFIYRN